MMLEDISQLMAVGLDKGISEIGLNLMVISGLMARKSRLILLALSFQTYSASNILIVPSTKTISKSIYVSHLLYLLKRI